jgi:SIT family siderophore-iron:H+ symporter-like MFS transporter
MSASSVDNCDAKRPIESTSKPIPSPPVIPLVGTESPGVARIKALNAHTSFANRCFIFFGIFLVAYAYGLDGTLRYTYQPYATAGFQEHSTLATISRVKSI